MRSQMEEGGASALGVLLGSAGGALVASGKYAEAVPFFVLALVAYALRMYFRQNGNGGKKHE